MSEKISKEEPPITAIFQKNSDGETGTILLSPLHFDYLKRIERFTWNDTTLEYYQYYKRHHIFKGVIYITSVDDRFNIPYVPGNIDAVLENFCVNYAESEKKIAGKVKA